MLTDDYWFPWYPAKMRADTMHLTALQDGIYRRLIDHYMETKTGLPDNDHALARIAGVDVDCFVDNSGIIRGLFKSDDQGKLIQTRCEKELKKQKQLSKKRAKNGKKGGQKRAEKNKENQGDASKCQANAKQMPDTCSSQSKHKTRQDKTGQDRIKGDSNQNQESIISSSANIQHAQESNFGFSVVATMEDEDFIKAKELADGYDIYKLCRDFDDRVKSGMFRRPLNPPRAFLGWLEKYLQGSSA